jgi:hypothetical protein
MRWLLGRVLSRLGSRTIIGIGATLFLLDLVIPDPVPFLDEILILAGTILMSRWANREEVAADPTTPKPVGRGRTQA